MKPRILFFALTIVGVFALTSRVNVASASPVSEINKITKVTAYSVPVTGPNLTNATFEIQKFVSRRAQLHAVGTLTATYTDPITGLVTQITDQAVTIPVTNITGSCQILHLELGPLDLDLLGLQIHLDKVVLDITAQSGPGNLLGNLLCAVANLLNGQGSLASIAQLLNQILAILG